MQPHGKYGYRKTIIIKTGTVAVFKQEHVEEKITCHKFLKHHAIFL